jgi:NAD(P)-dependent dehydrogenase (short-subunit alcohol dehydrogenase family)
VQANFGRLDILINNAGIWFRKPFMEITDVEWDRVLSVNLKGTFMCAQRAARMMIPNRTGSIINIASHSGIFYSRGQGAHYAASKAAIIQLTRVLAFELSPLGIRINSVAPGGIDTEFRHRFIRLRLTPSGEGECRKMLLHAALLSRLPYGGIYHRANSGGQRRRHRFLNQPNMERNSLGLDRSPLALATTLIDYYGQKQ